MADNQQIMEALAASDALLLKIFQGLLPYDE